MKRIKVFSVIIPENMLVIQMTDAALEKMIKGSNVTVFQDICGSKIVLDNDGVTVFLVEKRNGASA